MGHRLAPVGARQVGQGARASRQGAPRPARCQRSASAPSTSQAASDRRPIGRQGRTSGLHRPGERAKRQRQRQGAAQGLRRSREAAALPRQHGADAAGCAASATMKGVKAMSKNGGPTESLRSKNISATSGQIVPTKTTKDDDRQEQVVDHQRAFAADRGEDALRLHRAGAQGKERQRAAHEDAEDHQDEYARARGRWRRRGPRSARPSAR